MTEFLTAEQILGADDMVYGTVPAPEWGGTLRVRGFTALERGEWEASFTPDKTGKPNPARVANMRQSAVAKCAVNGAGERLFTTPEQVQKLGAKSAAPISRAFDRIMDLSGLSKEEREKMEGNSEDPSAAGSSA